MLPHETRDTLFCRVFGDEYAKVRAFGVDAESEGDAIALVKQTYFEETI